MQHTAIIEPGETTLTYAELCKAVDQIRSVASQTATARSARIGIILPNGIDCAVAFLGIASNATALPLNPMLTVEEMKFYLTDAEAVAVWTNPEVVPRAATAAKELGLPLLGPGIEPAASQKPSTDPNPGT